jgi:formate C-acetyltransferase
MNPRIENLKEYILGGKHHPWRRTPEQAGIATLSETFAACGMKPTDRTVEMLRALLAAETPVILPGEKIVFTRTVTSIPDIFTPAEWEDIKKEHYLHERGTLSNLSVDYATTLNTGLGERREQIEARMAKDDLNDEQRHYLAVMLAHVGLVQDFIEKYATHADGAGQKKIAASLRAIRSERPASLRDALQLLRVLHFMLWENGNYHNTLGRFDQYMYPFFRDDLDRGRISREEAYDLITEFFLTCNKDSDLYPGMQQGDNGQSMVLGGRSANGDYLFNELSEMCLLASCELAVIDPKINLRVDSQTPLEVFELGSHLTKRGLGFPQYSNDDVVIPGLIRKGYSPEDARDYVVAACWEFIIPGFGMDIPNIDAVSFAKIVSDSVDTLGDYATYDDYYQSIEERIALRFEDICAGHRNLYISPAPYLSLLMHGCVENACDITLGGKYNNYGIHGTGIATAADSLAAIKKYYFEEKTITADALITALKDNFAGAPELYEKLRFEAPKMGQDDDYVDSIASDLLTSFDKALEGAYNERGGVYRAGTGTAMYYIFHGAGLPATPDGRKADEVIPANFSPSLFFKHKGPVSVIKSFTKADLQRTINGGPLTLEFDESVFRNEESIQKLAMLVKSFITLGGHQLQLNTVDRDKLLDAQAHPERYRNLIVRVWGWSGYFVELDKVYQDHILQRLEYAL